MLRDLTAYANAALTPSALVEARSIGARVRPTWRIEGALGVGS
jgi:hypothetical protein